MGKHYHWPPAWMKQVAMTNNDDDDEKADLTEANVTAERPSKFTEEVTNIIDIARGTLYVKF